MKRPACGQEAPFVGRAPFTESSKSIDKRHALNRLAQRRPAAVLATYTDDAVRFIVPATGVTRVTHESGSL